jgi:DNA-binding transcriptional LysR family regulator
MRNTFSVGSSTIPGGIILPKIMPEWIKRHPDISLRVDVTDSLETFQKVKRGEYEIGIIGTRYDDDEIQYTSVIHGDRLVLIANREHPLAQKATLSLNDLKGQAFISREEGSGTRATFEKAMQAAGFSLADLNLVAEIGNTEGVIQAVQAGAGISVVSEVAVKEVANCGDVVVLPLPIQIARDFYIITNRTKPLSPQAKDVLALLEDLIEHPPAA